MSSGAGAGVGAGASHSSKYDAPVPMASRAVSCERVALSVLVVGASGDLAKKKTYPSLFQLYVRDLMPEDVVIIGYARRPKTDEDFREHLRPFLETKGDAAAVDKFLKRCWYRDGQYDSAESFAKVSAELTEMEDKVNGGCNKANRLFYYAIPPPVFTLVSKPIKECATTDRGWNRVVVEKPFGHDLASSKKLSHDIGQYFTEEEVYRIDHYLGKEMVQNLMVLRFGNTVFEPLWNRHHIKTVQIIFKEPFGAEGRGGYFDQFGIIRDVMQNHLMQVLTLVAMEPPVSMGAEDIRDEKVKVLKSIPPLVLEETVLGQYTANRSIDKPGYHDDDTVPAGSVTPTFAATLVHINNPRWAGVPFILKCGKALNSRKAEVRIQFHPKPNLLFSHQTVHRNELVIRIQPKEAIYMKVMSKLPGLTNELVETELDLSYRNRYPNVDPPDAYARLVLDVIRGDKAPFVRGDELNEAWRIFTPLLHQIEADQVQPLIYTYGSRGPPAADALIRKAGYIYGPGYTDLWKRQFAPADDASMSDLVDLENQFALTTEALRGLVNSFVDEMRRGLCGEDSSIKMIPSYVTQLPTGKEVGQVWAMDLGGSNVRVVSYSLLGDGKMADASEIQARIPDRVKKGSAEEMFDWLALMLSKAKVPAGAKLGFTFSFPVQQSAVDAGSLIHWTKGFTTRGVPGQDVVGLLRAALERKGMDITISALVNDTVGTLIAKRYQDPNCTIGVILGTGTNACYVEEAANVTKWKGEDEGIIVVNTEWGGFGSGSGGRRILPLTAVDQALHAGTPRPTSQRFEKMISGEFLGEMARLALDSLAAKGALWTGESAPGNKSILKRPWQFRSEYLPELADDESKSLDHVASFLRDRCGVPEPSDSDLWTVKRVCIMVTRRAARLAAMAIAAVVTHMELKTSTTVGIDGSVYLKFPHFREWMLEALVELGCDVVLAPSKDGSGAGAALIALTH